VKALHGIAPSGASTWDSFLGHRNLLFSLHKRSQPEGCTGRAALAGARVMKRRAGVRGRDPRPSSGLAPA